VLELCPDLIGKVGMRLSQSLVGQYLSRLSTSCTSRLNKAQPRRVCHCWASLFSMETPEATERQSQE